MSRIVHIQKKIGLFIALYLLYTINLYSQSAFIINNFTKNTYKAANQNWALAMDSMGNVFAANNKGLLVYNGAGWKLFQMPSKTIIRSVAVIGNKVYTGSYQEFGYWQKNGYDSYKYHSISKLLKNFNYNNDEIWNIVSHNNKIYFQSFGAIFEYDFKTVKALKIPGPVMFLLKIDNRLFIQHIGNLLYEIKNSELHPVAGSTIFIGEEVKAGIRLKADTLLFGTGSGKLFSYDNTKFEKWNCEIDNELKQNKLNKAVAINDKIIIGTLLNGLYILNKSGKLLFTISTEDNLQNNTILSLQPDSNNNLWVGMDKGIDYVSFNSPITVYIDKQSKNSAVYCAALKDSILYVGTNHGIYLYQFNAEGKLKKQNLIKNSQGQVWFISLIDDFIFAGLNDGTYIIKNNELIRISEVTGGYNMHKLRHFNSDYLIQSTYSSLVIYHKVNDTWQFKNVMNGFIAPAPGLVPDLHGYLWLSHSIKGIYKLQYSTDLTKIINIESFFDNDSIMPACTQIAQINNQIVFCTDKQLYTYDNLNKKIIPYTEMNKQLAGFEKSTRIIPSKETQYWFLNKNEIALFDIKYNKVSLLFRLLPDVYNMQLIENYENIVRLNDTLSLICLDNGFTLLNHKYFENPVQKPQPPEIRRLYATNKLGEQIQLINSAKDVFKISGKWNNLSFVFIAKNQTGLINLYQYKLENLDTVWSDWTTKTNVEYKRIPAGYYTFRIRTLNANGIVSPESSIQIRILRPWFLLWPMILVYVFIVMVIAFSVRILLKKRWQKQKHRLIIKEQQKIKSEKEATEQLIMKLENEKLQSEVSFKSNQLATSTMAIIAKNELLNEIKEELEKFKEELGYRLPKKYYNRILTLIEQNMASENDWQTFENLFDQAHEDFFKRMKTSFPDLTPGDLKFCAYLRLNLSSKEIAHLLNISVRGVEVHRYRLRKRLNLSPTQNLVEFIMNF